MNYIAQDFNSLRRIVIVNMSFNNAFQIKLSIRLCNKINDVIFIKIIACKLIINI